MSDRYRYPGLPNRSRRSLRKWLLAGIVAVSVLSYSGTLLRGTAVEADPVNRILADINDDRRQAGLVSLELDQRLVEVAAWRAERVSQSGNPSSSVATYQRMNTMLFDHRYAAHTWTSGTLLGAKPESLVRRWRAARPDWWEDSIRGDFEHIGIAIAGDGERLASTVVLAISRRTVEWRDAAPLQDLAWVRAEILDEVNMIRARLGRQALEPHPQLDLAAQRHAEDQQRRGFYSHQSPDGEEVRDRVRAAGFDGRGFVAENIAKGQFEPREVVRRWMNSSGHRRNIELPRARFLGVGVAYGENKNGFEVLWVQVLAAKK